MGVQPNQLAAVPVKNEDRTASAGNRSGSQGYDGAKMKSRNRSRDTKRSVSPVEHLGGSSSLTAGLVSIGVPADLP